MSGRVCPRILSQRGTCRRCWRRRRLAGRARARMACLVLGSLGACGQKTEARIRGEGMRSGSTCACVNFGHCSCSFVFGDGSQHMGSHGTITSHESSWHDHECVIVVQLYETKAIILVILIVQRRKPSSSVLVQSRKTNHQSLYLATPPVGGFDGTQKKPSSVLVLGDASGCDDVRGLALGCARARACVCVCVCIKLKFVLIS